MTDRPLALFLAGIVRSSRPLLLAATFRPIGCSRFVHLLATVVHHPFGILQHLLSPQFEEVVRVGVEFQAILTVVSIAVQFIKWRWFVAGLKTVRKRALMGANKCNSTQELTWYTSSMAVGIVARENIC